MILLIRAPDPPAGMDIYQVPYHWRRVAESANKQVLEDFARDIPLEHFFRWQRRYKIIGDAT